MSGLRVALVAAALVVSACSPSTSDCTPKSSTNAVECPKSWPEARALCDAATRGDGGTCSPAGTTCSYPGMGDLIAGERCGSTAVADCGNPAGGSSLDAGVNVWRCAQ